jgi:hypothetical protein
LRDGIGSLAPYRVRFPTFALHSLLTRFTSGSHRKPCYAQEESLGKD